MSWPREDDGELLELRRKLKDTETHILSLQNEQFKKDQEFQEVKRSRDELLFTTRQGIARIDEVEKELEKKNSQLQQEIIKRHNIETALSSATQNLKESAKSSRDLQRELDMFSPTSSVPAATHDKVLAERSSLQARVRELEREIQERQSESHNSSPRRTRQPPSAQMLDYENRILALESENKRLAALTPHTPRRATAHSGRRRSSSLSLPAAQGRVVELQEELLAVQSALEAQEAKSAKLNQDLMQAENAILASDRKALRAKEEAEELRDELTELRQAVDEMSGRENQGAEWETKAQALEEERSKASRRADAAESEVVRLKSELAACRSELEETVSADVVSQLHGRIRELEEERDSLAARSSELGNNNAGSQEQQADEIQTGDKPCSNCAVAMGESASLRERLDAVDQEFKQVVSLKAAADDEIRELRSQLTSKDDRPAPQSVDEDDVRRLREEGLAQDRAFLMAREEAETERLRLSQECADLSVQIRQKETRVLEALSRVQSESATAWSSTASGTVSHPSAEASSPSPSAPSDLASHLATSPTRLDPIPRDHVEYIARLLDAVERLRTERDELRRSVAFAQKEHGFAVADLEVKLAAIDEKLDRATAEASELPQVRQQLEQARETIIAYEAKATQASHAIERADSTDRVVKRLELLATGAFVSLQNTDARACITEQQLHSIQHSLSEAVARATAAADELCFVREELESKKQVIEQLQHELSTLTHDRITLQLEVQQLTASVNLAHTEAVSAQETIEHLQKDLASSSVPDETIVLLRAQRDELQAKVAARTEELASQMRDMQRLEMNLRVAEDTIEELQDEIKARSDHMDRADQETNVSDIPPDVTEMYERLGRSQRVMPLSNESDVLSQEELDSSVVTNRDLQARLDTLRASHEELVAFAQKADEAATERLATTIEALFVSVARTRALSASVQGLHTSLSTAQQSVESKTEELLAMATELEAVTSERVQTLDDLQALHTQQTYTTKALDEATQSIQRLSEELSTARTEVEIMSERLIKVQSSTNYSVEDAHQKVERLTSTIAELEAQLKSSREMLADVTRSREEIEQSWEAARGEIAELHIALDTARNEAARVTVFEGLVSSLQSSIKQRQDELETTARSHADELSAAVAEVDSKRQDLEQTISALQSRLDVLQAKNDELEGFAEKAREFDGLNQQLQINLAAHAEESKALNEELQSTRAQLMAQIRRVEHLEKELTALGELRKEEQQRLQVKLDEANDRLALAEDNQVRLAADLEAAQSAAARHERIAVTADMDKANLQVDLKNAQGSRARLGQQLEASTAEVRALKDEVTALQTRLADLQATLSVSQYRVAELTRPTSHPPSSTAAAELSTLKSQVEEHERLLRRQAEEIEEADDKMIRLLKENNKLKTRVESLTKKLVGVQGKYQALKEGGASEAGEEGGRKTPVPKTPSLALDTAVSRTPAALKTPVAAPSPSSRSFSRTNSISNNIFGSADAVPPVPPLPRSASTSANLFAANQPTAFSGPRLASGSLNIFGPGSERPLGSALPPVPPVPSSARTPSNPHPTTTTTPGPIPAQLSPIRPLRIPSKSTPGPTPAAVPPSPVAGKKRPAPSDFSSYKEDLPPLAIVRQSPAVLRVKTAGGRSGFTPVRSPHHSKRFVTDITNTPTAGRNAGGIGKEVAGGKRHGTTTTTTTLASGRVMSSKSMDLLEQISMAMGSNRL